MIKSIIFDWGGVLIYNPTPGLITYFAKYFNVTEKEFNKVYKKYKPPFQKGKISENSLWEKVCSNLSVPKPNVKSLWKDTFTTVYEEQKEIFSIASSLKKNYKIGLLSNTEIPTMNFFYEQQYDMFDVVVFSCKEGTIKPEKRIYEITVKRLSIDPQETIFVDDKKEFITAAQKAGLNTILFRNVNQFKKELTSFSLTID